MIQRIQTLYLLLVVVLTGLALWLPLVDFTVGADTCTLTAFGLKDAAGITLLPTVYLGVVLVAACLVPLVTISFSSAVWCRSGYVPSSWCSSSVPGR